METTLVIPWHLIWSFYLLKLKPGVPQGSPYLLQMLVEGLGWPTSKPEADADAQQWHTSPVLRGGSQRSAEDELKYQTLTLQVVSVSLTL